MPDDCLPERCPERVRLDGWMMSATGRFRCNRRTLAAQVTGLFGATNDNIRWDHAWPVYLTDKLAHLGEKLAGTEGFGDIAVAAGCFGLLLVACERIGRDGDDRDHGQVRLRLDAPCRLVSVKHWQLDGAEALGRKLLSASRRAMRRWTVVDL